MGRRRKRSLPPPVHSHWRGALRPCLALAGCGYIFLVTANLATYRSRIAFGTPTPLPDLWFQALPDLRANQDARTFADATPLLALLVMFIGLAYERSLALFCRVAFVECISLLTCSVLHLLTAMPDSDGRFFSFPFVSYASSFSWWWLE